MATKLPAIPDVSSADIPLIVKRAIAALRARSIIREAEGPNTDPLDKVMTFRDATTLSLVERSGSGFAATATDSSVTNVTNVITGGTTEDATPPPAITGVTVIAGHSTAFISFDQPSYVKSGTFESNHAYTVIYRAAAVAGSSPGFGAAVELGHTETGFYADPIDGANVKYFYWLKNVSQADVDGPVAGGTDGFEATSGGVGATHVDLLTANRLFAVDGTFGNVLANTIGVLNASIKGTISSDDYVAGANGWSLTKSGSGTLEVNNGIFRSTILGGSASTFGTGTGFFAGVDSSIYKVRMGTPAAARAEWTGSSFDVYNAANELVISAGDIVKLKDATVVVATEHIAPDAVTSQVYNYIVGPLSTPSGSPTVETFITASTVSLVDADVLEWEIDVICEMIGITDFSGGGAGKMRVLNPDLSVLASWQKEYLNNVTPTPKFSITEKMKGVQQGTYTLQFAASAADAPSSNLVTLNRISFIGRQFKR